MRSTIASGLLLVLSIATGETAGAQKTGHHPAHHPAPTAKPATKPAAKPTASPTRKPSAQAPAQAGGKVERSQTPASRVGRPDSASQRPDSTVARPSQGVASPEPAAHAPVVISAPAAMPHQHVAVPTSDTVPVVGGQHVHATATQPEPESDSTRVPTNGPNPSSGHQMWMQSLGQGWQLMGMAQVFPTMTTGSPWRQETLLNGGLYATQPAVMVNLASPNARVVLRTTLNFEAWTQREGELTFGGWGEGFIDSRHPHTLVHEAMLTANWWDVGGGALSVSAGKGFAPYGTDDPMGRPTVKFPTNHHLSQVLERWTLNAAYLRDGWSLEAGLFGGGEPTGPYDFSNIESFGDSWSARVSKRLGDGFGPAAPWELSASFAYIEEEHHGAVSTTELYNASARYAGAHDFGTAYGLVEASRSDPRAGKGYYSFLAEGQLGLGRESRHQPYARAEYATRPEYEREGAPGTPGFFRYDHDSHEIGATRWAIGTVGYGYESSRLPTSIRPYVELQHNWVSAERGGVDPRALYGDRQFWSASVGARIFFGGGPMRMGSYGMLDPMTAAMRPGASGSAHDGHTSH